jgi:hypothetical protein
VVAALLRAACADPACAAQAGGGLPAWTTQAAGFASVPMSKFEPDTKINYEAMDDKLKARRRACAGCTAAALCASRRSGGR